MQYYPAALKVANIIPIPKPAKNAKYIESYRPISLLNTLTKTNDTIILNRLKDIERDKHIIPQEQYGFREGHSTVTQVLRIAHQAKEAYNDKKQTVLVALDTEKAFDMVWT